MARYDFTASALDDLKEIGHYTRKAWAFEQARRYREQLQIAFQKLSLSPNMGRQGDAIAAGVRSYRVAAHIAFYFQHQDSITILRVLQPSMDAEAAFE